MIRKSTDKSKSVVQTVDKTSKEVSLKFRSSLFKGLWGQGAKPLSHLARCETPKQSSFVQTFLKSLSLSADSEIPIKTLNKTNKSTL